ncbi:MAG TPA: AIR synthase-related protein [Candidatus Paceibacterota bacterium]
MYNPTKPYKHQILKLIESTWQTPHVKIERGLYPIIKKKFSFPEIQHTDGIGTKGVYYWRKRTFKNAVIDALAMNLNDLAMMGAVPYALQNHIVLPRDDHFAILKIVHALVSECKKRKIVMTGGETSIHNNTSGMDISITVSGFVKSRRKNQCKIGDILIGLKSNGLHSNGITKARSVFSRQYQSDFIKPTAIYLDIVLSLLSKYKINGMMHITGGAFTKIKDILSGADAIISQPKTLMPQKIFYELYNRGVSSRAMYSTFNCGIGFVLSVPPHQAKKIIAKIKNAAIIGKVCRGNGTVLISSAFDGKLLKL